MCVLPVLCLALQMVQLLENVAQAEHPLEPCYLWEGLTDMCQRLALLGHDCCRLFFVASHQRLCSKSWCFDGFTVIGLLCLTVLFKCWLQHAAAPL